MTETRYVVVKMSDNKWHVFDQQTRAEITLRGMTTKKAAQAIAQDMEANK